MAKETAAQQFPSGTRGKPTAARQCIDAVLALKPNESSINSILQALPALKAAPLPCITSTDLLLPHLNPRQSCFDSDSNGGPPTWTCSKLCARCAVLNRLLQVSTAADLVLASNLVGQILLTTSCEDDGRKGETPPLPRELADIVFSYALANLRTSESTAAFCSLLHVSSWVRLKMLQAFEPIELWDCDICMDYELSTSVHRSLAAYACDLPEYLLADVTIRRHGLKLPARRVTGKLLPGKVVRMIEWSVKVEVGDIYGVKGILKRKANYLDSRSTRDAHVASSLLTMVDACDALYAAFDGLDASAWRFASPFQRLLSGTLAIPATIATIEVTLELPHQTSSHGSVHRRWKFQTLGGKDFIR